jgi:hypothetical protein
MNADGYDYDVIVVGAGSPGSTALGSWLTAACGSRWLSGS